MLLGRGFVDLILRGRHLDHDGDLVLRTVAETAWYYPPFEHSCPGYPNLHARLKTTEEVLVGWAFGEVAPEVLLEELHAACELTLEEAVNRRSKRLSFAELVAAADATGIFSSTTEGGLHPADLLLA